MKKSLLLYLLTLGILFTSSIDPDKHDVFSDEFIVKQMKKAADWQFDNFYTEAKLVNGKSEDVPQTGWIRGAFYTGVMALYETTGDNIYLRKMLEWGKANEWKPGKRERHADDHIVGQTYLDLYFIKGGQEKIKPLQQRFDMMIEDPKPGPKVGWSKKWNWSWCDALYMAPPAMVKMYIATNDKKYLQLMDQMWWETTEYLYSPTDSLFYRDANYKPKAGGTQVLTKHGNPIFWGRGNGWVIGGLVKVLQGLPKDHSNYEKYVRLYKEMAAKIASLQGQDGLWRSSLLDPEEFPQPETSSSGFFCYAIAWGINEGHLSREKYIPIVKEAWRGLVWALQPNGKMGWVQQVGHDPRAVSKDDSMEYGIGAFLLAGSQVKKLKI